MRFVLRLSMLLLVLIATAPAAFAQYSGCNVCKSIHFSDGSEYWWCGDPPPLMFGRELCEIGDDPYVYCQTFGDECCIDPM